MKIEQINKERDEFMVNYNENRKAILISILKELGFFEVDVYNLKGECGRISIETGNTIEYMFKKYKKDHTLSYPTKNYSINYSSNEHIKRTLTSQYNL